MPRHDSVADVEPGAPVTSPSGWTRELWRGKWMVVFVLIVTVAVAAAVWSQAPNTYRATASVKVSSGGISEGPQSTAQLGTLLATQVAVLQSTQLANDVAERLDGSVSIVSTVIAGVPESQVATVTVEATTAAGAAQAANEYVLTYQARRDRGVVEEATARSDTLQGQIDEVSTLLEETQADLDEESQRINLEQARITIARDSAARAGLVLDPEDVVQPNTSTLNALQARYSELASQATTLRTEQQGYDAAAADGDGGVAIVSVAREPSAPANPGLQQTLSLAGVLGLGLGLGLALVLGVLDRRLHDVAAVQRAVPGTGVLATVDKKPSGSPVAVRVGDVLLPTARGQLVDAYLEVGLTLAAQWPEPMRSLLVCSPSRHEDDLAAAGSLAVAFALLGKHVVLVDVGGPPGSPDDGSDGPGWQEVAEGRTALSDALVPVDVPGDGSLHVLPSGRAGSESELAHSGLRVVLHSLGGDDGVVIVQGPPLHHDAVSIALAPEVDGVLVPVRLGTSRGPLLASAHDRLLGVGGRLVGVVVHPQTVDVDNSPVARVSDAAAPEPDDQRDDDPAADRSVSSSSLA